MSGPLEPIAIVGVGCRFAGGADTPGKFWDILRDGVDASCEVPAGRWNTDVYFDPDAKVRKGKTYCKRAGFLDDITRFDPVAFGISPREAHVMDPQQRILLEVTHEAFEDAGIPASKYQGSETGVYIGLMNHDYSGMQDNTVINNFTSPGTATSIASNRISFGLDLRGPSLTIDTACSSSLVGAHFALQSLRSGETDMAVVGGVNVMATHRVFITLSRIGMLSPDGRCKAFDASGDGYGRGEGAGVVIMKRLSDAIRDGDEVYCTILGSAVNSDGRASTPITAPNQGQQEHMLRKAYKMAGVSPGDVQYMEAHGTGTLKGDPIEANAIGAVLGEGRTSSNVLSMGSVKTNIGHVEAGAGVAALIKVALSMKHRQVPPSIHFKNPNPLIDFAGLKMSVNTKLSPWPMHGASRMMAGVNSFGFGGTNSHAVILEPPAEVYRGRAWDRRFTSAHSASETVYAFPISAYMTTALPKVAETMAQGVREHVAPVEDVCYTAAVRRSHRKFRAVALGRSKADIVSVLERLAAGEPSQNYVQGSASTSPAVALAFSGSGTEWPGMGAKLAQAYPEFLKLLRQVDTAARRFVSWSIVDEINKPAHSSRMNDLRVCQLCIFAVQIATVRLLQSWGLEVAAVVGHSIGEVAAAVTAGLLTLEAGAQLAQRLGTFAHSIAGTGAMVTAPTSAQVVEAAIASEGLQGSVGVAAVNDSSNVTISGTTAGMAALQRRLRGQGVECATVSLAAGFHSAAVEPYRESYFRTFADLRAVRGTVDASRTFPKFYSTCRPGAELGGDLTLDCSYWWDNARQQVQFARVVKDVSLELGISCWVEVAPTTSMAASLMQILRDAKHSAAVAASMKKGAGPATLALCAATLHVNGSDLHWGSMWSPEHRSGQACRFVPLPLYSWNHSEIYWSEGRDHYLERTAQEGTGPFVELFYPVTSVVEGLFAMEAQISTDKLPLLADHVYQNSVLLPATMYMEMYLSMGPWLFGPDVEFSLHELDLPQAMWFAPGEAREVRVEAVAITGEGSGESKGAEGEGEEGDGQPLAYRLTVSSKRMKTGSDDSTGAALEHSTCILRAATHASHTDCEAPSFAEVMGIRERGEHMEHEGWYQGFETVGFDFGPHFRNVRQAWKAMPEALGEIGMEPLVRETMGQFLYHPCILDAIGQVLDATVPKESSIPVNIGRITPHKHIDLSTMDRVYSYARMTGRQQEDDGHAYVLGDVFVYSETGELLLTMATFSCQVLDPESSTSHVATADESVYDITYNYEPLPLAEATSVPGNSLIIMPRGGGSIPKAEMSTLLSSLGYNESPRRCSIVEQDTVLVMSAQELETFINTEFAADTSRRGRRGRRGRKGKAAAGSGAPELKRVLLMFNDPRQFKADAGAVEAVRKASHYVAASVLHAVQAVSNIYSRAMSSAPWLYFITCGAVAPDGKESGLGNLMNAVHGSAHGYRRTLAHEFPSLKMRVVDVGEGGSSSRDVAALVDELGTRTDSEEVALRHGNRYVAQYRNIPEELVTKANGEAFTVAGDGTVVVIGGCRGLGLKLSRFLVSRGARALVLVSRSGVQADGLADVEAMRAGGAQVVVHKADVTSAADVDGIFSMIARSSTLPSRVAGVIHSAMILDDGLVISQTSKRVNRVLDPKVVGAALLHQATLGMDLDFFTLFSSTTALFGNQGQFSYGGANAFLDALSHHRARLGKAGVAVNWGAFKGIGYLAHNTSVEKSLRQRGWEGIDEGMFYDFFCRFTASQVPQASLALADLGKWFKGQPWALSSPMYAVMAVKAQQQMDTGGAAGASGLLREVQGLGDEDGLATLVAWCRSILAISLDLDIEDVDAEASFPALGVDSLMGMEVRNAVADELSVDMPLALMFADTSVKSLAEFLLQQVREMAPVDAGEAEAGAASPGSGEGGSSSPSAAATARQVASVPDTKPVMASDAAKAAASHIPNTHEATPSIVSVARQQPQRQEQRSVRVVTKPASPPPPASPSPAAHSTTLAVPQLPASPVVKIAPASVNGTGLDPRATVSAVVLTEWLSRAMAVKNAANPLPKFAYPSPGSLHPVQVYVVLPPNPADASTSRVQGVPPGQYYYHPVEHKLYGLREPASSSSAALQGMLAAAVGDAGCPFYAVLVGNLAAIEPVYGAAARPFLFFEAGAVTRALKEGGVEAGVPLKYTVTNSFDAKQTLAVKDALALTEEDHVLLRCVYVS